MDRQLWTRYIFSTNTFESQGYLMKKPTLAVIGAGISGLTVANKLRNDFEITVYEKSRGVGGRMATRTAPPFQFDHGAQFFTAKSQKFKDFLNPFIKNKAIARWDAKFVEFDKNQIISQRSWSDNLEHYVGTPKMTSLCKAMSCDINVHYETTISKCSFIKNKWHLHAKDKPDFFEHDWLILAMPAAQTTDLLPDEVPFKSQILEYKMSSCTTLMLGFKEPLPFDWHAALVRNADISWISVNSSKMLRNTPPSLVVHSTNDWSDKCLSLPLEAAKEHLLNELKVVTSKPIERIVHQDIHRWRYANILKQEGPESFLNQEYKVGVVGDWCIRGFVEGAFKSACSLASKLSN